MSRLYLDSISQHESNHDENSKSNAKDKEEEARKPGEGWKGPGEMYGSQQMKNKHCSNRDWSLTNGQSDATKPVLYYPSHPRQCLGLRRNFKVVPEKKDFPVLHHLMFCFICSIRASLIRLSDFVSEI